MATSGSKSVTVTSYDTLEFSWSESSQSVAENKTTIAWTLKLIAGSSGRIQSSVNKNWSVTVNGQKYSGTNSIAIGNNETKTLASGTTTIAHSSDGTKTFSYSFSQQIEITYSGSWIGTKSGSGTGTLDPIARKSTLSVTNGTLGIAQTLTISEQVSSYEHRLSYSCGSSSGYILGNATMVSTDNSKVWTPPLELAKENKTGTSVSIKFTLYTYTSGGTLVGSNTYTKTFAIPSSVKPSCSISVSDETSHYNTFGAYVQGLSKLNVTITPTLGQGSPIASYSSKFNNVVYTTSTFKTGVVTTSGAVSITANVTDQRGRKSDTATKSLTILEYTAPVVTALAVHRCNSDGTKNDQGGNIKVEYSCSISPLNNKNTATYKLQYKAANASSFTTVSLSHSTTSYDVSSSKIFAADTEQSYEIRLLATDKIQTATRITSASTAHVIMDFGADGKSIGFGKVAEKENTAEFGLDASFEGNVYGKAYGLGGLPVIPETENLNNYTEPGCWCIPTNASASTMMENGLNVPIPQAGRLIVENSSGWDDPSTEFKYRLQTYIPYLTIYPTMVRYIRKTSESSWIYQDWRTLVFPTKDITFTPESGVTVTRCTVSINNDIATMCFSGKYNSAIATSVTSKTIGRISEGFPAKSVVTCGLQGTGIAACWVTNTGAINIRPTGTAYTANSVIEFNLTWNVAASW
jgi:hypothetical protein